MAEQLTLHCQAVQTFVQQLGDSPGARKILLSQRTHVEQRLQELSLSVQEAGRVLAAIESIPWPAGAKEGLTSLIAARTAAPPVFSASARSRLQDFRALSDYFTEEQWAALLNDRTSAQSKLDMVISQAVSLQLRNPSEFTYQRLVALYLACTEGYSKAVGLNAQVKYNSVQHLKRCFRAAPKPPLELVLLSLPSEWTAFAAAHPLLARKVFGAQTPAKCPLGQAELDSLANSVPLRSTSKLMFSADQPLSRQASAPSADMMSMFAALHQMLINANSAPPPPLIIHMFPRRTPALPSPNDPTSPVSPPLLRLGSNGAPAKPTVPVVDEALGGEELEEEEEEEVAAAEAAAAAQETAPCTLR